MEAPPSDSAGRDSDGPQGYSWALFVGLTYLVSWLCWGGAAFARADVTRSAWLIPYTLGGWAPSLVGVALFYWQRRDGATRRDLWRRAYSLRRITWRWRLGMVLVFPALAALSLALDALLSGGPPALSTLRQMRASPLLLPALLLATLLQGPVSEELGWRGYALDGLQRAHGPLVASVILGAAWALWHIPLFLVRGTSQYDVGLGSAQFWLFLGVGIPLSILMTWAYNANDRSILTAIVLHWGLNLTLTLAHPMSLRAMLLLVASLHVVALAAIALGPRGVTGWRA